MTGKDQPNSNPIHVALDTVDLARAQTLARALAGAVGGIKLGKEFFTAHGPQGVRAVQRAAGDSPLFLDLKFHDIPNTVAGAIRAAAPLEPYMINVHAAGGAAMMAAAARAAEEAAEASGCSRPKVLAVTVLTSLDESDLDAVGQRGPVESQVRRLAALALDSGLDGVVCSPREIAVLRRDLGNSAILVVPGVRPAGAAAGDQKRTTTPREAIEAGADVLVIGRPITQASDPAEAARQIMSELSGAR